ncbi:chitin synthase, partial [Helicosporidium sp. ATCC 50920]
CAAVMVTPDFEVPEVPLKEYYASLDQRLAELQSLTGATTGSMPSTYEKYVHGGASARGPPPGGLVSAREYYEQLKQLRGESQVYYAVAPEVHRDLMWDDVEVEDASEYLYCRYTPVTTEDARDFGADGYSLRMQHRYGRHIKLLICVTLYNEDVDTLKKTLNGVCENLEVLYRQYSRDGSRHGLDWTEVAVAVVQDGNDHAEKGVLAQSAVAGYYSENLKQETAVGLPTSVHLFEYTARFKKHAGLDCYPPLQVLFASKATNRGKLDSHCWFFDGFAHLLQPEYCVLFDAGTRPLPMALRNCYAHFRNNPWCGALTGELRVERPYRNFLTSVQYMEWKVAHFLSKPIESVCGYMTVLPGAFSAFRWSAVEGEPLRRYFYGLYSQADLSAFEANMYLAEDRVLCLEIVARKNARFYLEYVKEAVAEADPVTKLAGLIKQRRRWLNGTFFAIIYTLANWSRIWTESHHSFLRKMVLSFEFVYLAGMTLVGTWLGIGTFYTILDQLFRVLFQDSVGLQNLGLVLTTIYMLLIVLQFVVNLKNKPEAVEKVHLFCTVYFMLYMITFTAVTIWFLSGYSMASILTNISQLGALLTIGALLLAALMHGDGMAMMGAGIQYWVMQPVFYNVLQVNAFCNTDDVTWGTKNLDTKRDVSQTKSLLHTTMGYSGPASKESKSFWKAMLKVHEKLTDMSQVKAYNAIKEAKLKAFATYLLLAWIISNVLFVKIVTTVSALSWEVCDEGAAQIYGRILSSKMDDADASQAVGEIVYAAQAIVQQAAAKYPFGGLPNFPEAYPILLSGSAQSNASMGAAVTVLASSADVFASLPSALPSFERWLNYSSGVDLNRTIDDIASLRLPAPVDPADDNAVVPCRTEYGRTYYLTIQFSVLCFLVGMQAVGSIVFALRYYLRRLVWRVRNARGKRRVAQAASAALHAKKKDMRDDDEGGGGLAPHWGGG